MRLREHLDQGGEKGPSLSRETSGANNTKVRRNKEEKQNRTHEETGGVIFIEGGMRLAEIGKTLLATARHDNDSNRGIRRRFGSLDRGGVHLAREAKAVRGKKVTCAAKGKRGGPPGESKQSTIS